MPNAPTAAGGKKVKQQTAYHILYTQKGKPRQEKAIDFSFDIAGKFLGGYELNVKSLSATNYAYYYNAAGQLVLAEEFNQMDTLTEAYTYNTHGQIITHVVKINSSGLLITTEATQKYDALGNMVTQKIVNEDGSTSANVQYFYDNKNRRVKSIDSVGSAENLIMVRKYTAFDSLEVMYLINQNKFEPTRYDTSYTEFYSYDSKNRILCKVVKDLILPADTSYKYTYKPNGGYILTNYKAHVYGTRSTAIKRTTYNAAGNIVEVIEQVGTPKQTTAVYAYNNDGLLLRIDTYDTANNIIDSFEYEYTFW